MINLNKILFIRFQVPEIIFYPKFFELYILFITIQNFQKYVFVHYFLKFGFPFLAILQISLPQILA